jgi:hypothetical protein
MKVRSLFVMPLVLFATTIAPAFGNAASTAWSNFGGSQSDCLRFGGRALTDAGLINIKVQPNIVYGNNSNGAFQSIIHCVADKRIVFFVTHGPEPSVNSAINEQVSRRFNSFIR